MTVSRNTVVPIVATVLLLFLGMIVAVPVFAGSPSPPVEIISIDYPEVVDVCDYFDINITFEVNEPEVWMMIFSNKSTEFQCNVEPGSPFWIDATVSWELFEEGVHSWIVQAHCRKEGTSEIMLGWGDDIFDEPEEILEVFYITQRPQYTRIFGEIEDLREYVDNQLETIDNRLDDLEHQVELAESDIFLLQELVTDLINRVSVNEDTIRELEGLYDKINVTLVTTNTTLYVLIEDFSNLNTTLGGYNLTNMANQMSTLDTRIVDAFSNMTELRTLIDQLRRDLLTSYLLLGTIVFFSGVIGVAIGGYIVEKKYESK